MTTHMPHMRGAHKRVTIRRCRREPEFLVKTIPYLKHNPQVGFVQARWVYANGRETLLTRVQEISLNFHIK